MPLIKVEEVKVIGNVIEDLACIRREKLTIIPPELACKINKESPVCPICNLKMDSPLGFYNGYSYPLDEIDGIWNKAWIFECSNFHFSSWQEQQSINEQEVL